MDKKTKKLLEEFNISEDDLKKFEAEITIDVSGRRNEIVSMVEGLNLSYEESDEDNMSGKEMFNVFGSMASIYTLLTELEQQQGTYFMVGVAIVATASVVYMSIPDAKKTLIEQKLKSKLKK